MRKTWMVTWLLLAIFYLLLAVYNFTHGHMGWFIFDIGWIMFALFMFKIQRDWPVRK